MKEVTRAPVPPRDVALCRSILYEALSLGFLPPTATTCERLGRDASTAALAEAALLLDDEAGTTLAAKANALSAAPDAADPQALDAAHARLFGHTAQGPAPPYETEYGEDEIFQKPQEMSDIAGFMAAFGIIPAPAQRERIDHIACELEFLAFLARKEAFAREIDDTAILAETHKATRLFLRDHLGRFVVSFVGRLRREAPQGFYAGLGELCLALVESDCWRYEVPLGLAPLRLRVPLDDGAPMACGVAEECPGACDPGTPETAKEDWL